MPSNINFTCPECGVTFYLTTPEINSKEKVICPNCDKEFKGDCMQHLIDGLISLERMHQDILSTRSEWIVDITSHKI
jgi:peptide subunit release factor 1 (eRF1)